MEIKIFQSSKGDCLMISSPDSSGKDRHILIDGGMAKSFREHVAPELTKLRAKNENVDLVCISHIDEDHIDGALEYMDHMVDWRVFRHHRDNLGRNISQPKNPEPPEISAIWHNAFSEQLGANTGNLESMLANYSTLVTGSGQIELMENAEIASSILQGIELSKKIGDRQLNIPLNPHHDGKMVMFRESEKDRKIKIGKMNLKVIGPTIGELSDLRDEWDKWIESNKGKVRELLEEMVSEEERLDLSFSSNSKLGDIAAVTESNLASIMCYLYQGHKEVLLTGDGHSKHILRGLEKISKLKSGKGLHVNVLKVQHHASKNNIDLEFVKRITADHYIFCGNGSHHNPHLDVLKLIISSRVGSSEEKSENSQTDRPFKFWFNSSSKLTTPSNVEDMIMVEELMMETRTKHTTKFDFQFMADNESFMTLAL